MNWISDWALPKIQTLFGSKRDVPENLCTSARPASR